MPSSILPAFIGRQRARVAAGLVTAALSLCQTAAMADGLAPAGSLPRIGPTLGAASNLAQGWQPNLVRLAQGLGVTDLRDGMNWTRVESVPQVYDFALPRTGFPAELAAAGIETSIVVNWGNPLYDSGDTPYLPQALSALGAYSRALVTQFPGIASLEVGNEFNGVNFVRGPIAAMTPQDRAAAYVPILAAVAAAARDARPDIRISGGASHSIAAGYLWAVLDAGGAGLMDALAIHPYTTPADQLVRQVAVLRRHPDAALLPIEMTEFGARNPALAAGHLVRNYCQMALSGVSRAIWYPISTRADGLQGLFTPEGRITTAGRAYRLVAARMQGRPATDAATDPFTYGCLFGGDTLVLWGAARGVRVAEGTQVFDAEGRAVTEPYALSPDAPLIFVGAEGVDVAQAVRLGDHGLIADSYYQFAYPRGDEALADGDGFARFARREGKEIPLVTLPGQEAKGTPWFPYRGNPSHRPLRLTADSMLPGGTAGRPIDIVHRYTASKAQTIDLEARFEVADRSDDGIVVSVLLNSILLSETPVTGAAPLDLIEKGLTLAQGDVLEIAVSPAGTPRGDLTDYRITLRAPS